MLAGFSALAILLLPAHAQVADPYAPLQIYNGKWNIKPDKQEKPDLLENVCARAGRFYVCEQTVNGKADGLVVFVPAEKPGQYYTQPLTADGHATGRGDLTIAGNHWEYSSKDDAAKQTWYRTLNDVSDGGNTIRFAVQKSSDGRVWETTLSGIETRVK